MDVQENLTKYGYNPEKVPIIVGSALMTLEDKNPKIGEQSILKLLEAVDNIPTPKRDINKPFLMYISDFFQHPKHGTIVTGKIEKGMLTKGDELEIIGFDLKAKTIARSIEMHHDSRQQFFAGDDVAVCLKDIDIEKLAKGQALVKPGEKAYASHTKFKALAYISSKEEGGRSTTFESNYRPQFYLNYGDVTGVIQLPDDKRLERVGEKAEFIVKLISDMVIEEGNNFLMREGEKTVVGSGTITEIIE